MMCRSPWYKSARWVKWLVLSFAFLPLNLSAQVSDSDKLGMALEYFQSGKYHECMLLLQKLDDEYQLNPRFKAYLGVCYYYEWDYKKATSYLDKAIPELSAFSPQERAVYYFANAESHFFLQEYDKALPYYKQMLEVCSEKEKPATYYRMGFINLQAEHWVEALDQLQNALVGYKKYLPKEKSRIAQIKNMINGCCEKIDTMESNSQTEGNKMAHPQEE
jgi:tetratricopeptide (TPR) repeat protein